MRRGPVDSGYVGELFPFVVEGKHGSEDGGIYRESLEFVLGYAHRGENLQDCLEALEFADGENRRWQEEIIKRHLALFDDRAHCLMSECNGWRWYHFEVLHGIHNWVMT